MHALEKEKPKPIIEASISTTSKTSQHKHKEGKK
jgi:hypothetical protein